MNESIPSKVHPAHAAQNPRRWLGVSGGMLPPRRSLSMSPAIVLGSRQVVRHRSLEPTFGGSNPPSPASVPFDWPLHDNYHWYLSWVEKPRSKRPPASSGPAVAKPFACRRSFGFPETRCSYTERAARSFSSRTTNGRKGTLSHSPAYPTISPDRLRARPRSVGSSDEVPAGHGHLHLRAETGPQGPRRAFREEPRRCRRERHDRSRTANRRGQKLLAGEDAPSDRKFSQTAHDHRLHLSRCNGVCTGTSETRARRHADRPARYHHRVAGGCPGFDPRDEQRTRVSSRLRIARGELGRITFRSGTTPAFCSPGTMVRAKCWPARVRASSPRTISPPAVM